MALVHVLTNIGLTLSTLLAPRRTNGVSADPSAKKASKQTSFALASPAGHRLQVQRTHSPVGRGNSLDESDPGPLVDLVLAKAESRGETRSLLPEGVGSCPRERTKLPRFLLAGVLAGGLILHRTEILAGSPYLRKVLGYLKRPAPHGEDRAGAGTASRTSQGDAGGISLPPDDESRTPEHEWEAECERWKAEVWDREALEEVIAFARAHLRRHESLGAAEETVRWVRPVLEAQRFGYNRERLEAVLTRLFKQSIANPSADEPESSKPPPYGPNACRRWRPWLHAAIHSQLR